MTVPSTPGLQDFQFIPVRGPKKNDPAIRSEVRRHVARQRGKKKRFEDVRRFRKLGLTGGEQQSWRAGVQALPSSASSTVSSSQSSSVISSPVSMLSQSRRDPFEVFPIPMQRIDLELIDFWTTDLTRTSYGMNLGETYVPMRDLFLAQAVEHETSTEGLLFLASIRMAMTRPARAGDVKISALQHRARLLELVNGALKRSDFAMPGLVQAIGFQIVYEAVRGDFHACRRHLMGMRSIVNAIGGPSSLNAEPRVQIIFIYLHLDSAPDVLPYPVKMDTSDPVVSQSGATLVYQSRADAAEVNQWIEEFLDFLSKISVLSARGWQHAQPAAESPFGPGTVFYTMLTPRWDEGKIPGGLGPHHITRMACLLLLCHAIVALKAPSQACDDYVMQQTTVVLREMADLKPDLRLFLHLLLKDPRAVRLRDLDAAYSAARSAQIVKRLNLSTHDRVARLLLGCLAATSGGTAESQLTPTDFARIHKEAFYFQPPPPSSS